MSEKLIWKGEVPVSTEYDDIYYSVEGGLAEGHYTFLNGNLLPTRLAALQAGDIFTVGELGFGTGLNFLVLCQLWSQSPAFKSGAMLHVYSVEKYPLPVDDLAKAHTNWPELHPFSAALLSQYTQAPQTTTTYTLEAMNLKLTLLIGDVRDVLPNAKFTADAWFLDGFNPAKNRSMWQPETMQMVGERTRKNGTFATYTIARFVRDGLEAAGFTLERQKGFGRKRDMLTGKKTEGAADDTTT